MKNLSLVLAAAAALSMTACRAKSTSTTGVPRAAAPEIDYKVVEQTANGLTLEYDTRVDILFVIDNSQSMEKHQKNLSENINKFVDGIAKVKTIDFHIGFTVIHDGTRFGKNVDRTCPDPANPGQTLLNWEDPGTLKALKGPSEKLAMEGRRFVTKNDENYQQILKESLDPQANRLTLLQELAPTQLNPTACPRGPQEEDSFTPLLKALSDKNVANGPNKGFRREGAFFVAVLLSDAKDASGLTPEQVAVELSRLTGESTMNKKRFRVFSVTMKPGFEIGTETRNHKICKPDPAWADDTLPNGGPKWPTRRKIKEDENPLAVLAKLTEDQATAKVGQVLSICDDNYGSTLAKFGLQVQQDALTDLTLELPERPQVTDREDKKLALFLGEHELTEGEHWSYDPAAVAITVYGQKIEWDRYPDAKLRVQFTPAKASLATTKAITH